LAPKDTKQAREKKEVARKTMGRPSGLLPLAKIQSRHGSALVTRAGRGFSMGELAAAGIPRNTAGKWGVQIDVRRRSSLEANVGALRTWTAAPPLKAARVGEAKKVEAEIAKIEKEVVHEAEKEVARAKRGAKKVEKEAAAVVEKPLKARQRKKKAPREKQQA
jgi:ribosomal protein L13E